MKIYISASARFAAALLTVTVLSACGASPSPSGAERFEGYQRSSGNENTRIVDRLEKILEEEAELLSNPDCGEAGDEFKPDINLIIGKFNDVVTGSEATGAELIPAGHPDSPDGISVRVCSGPRVEAYAYSRTIAIHEGLLYTLLMASEAYALFKDTPQRLDAALGEIAFNAENGFISDIFTPDEREALINGGYAIRAEELFHSATAFVVYHELGHTQPGQASPFAVSSETADSYMEFEADLFAVNMVKTAGFSTKGVDVVFAVLDRISPEGSIGHPTSWERAEMARKAGNENSLAMAAGDEAPFRQ